MILLWLYMVIAAAVAFVWFIQEPPAGEPRRGAFSLVIVSLVCGLLWPLVFGILLVHVSRERK